MAFVKIENNDNSHRRVKVDQIKRASALKKLGNFCRGLLSNCVKRALVNSNFQLEVVRFTLNFSGNFETSD